MRPPRRRGTALAVALGFVLTLVGSVDASFRRLAPDELRERSELIVTGQLIGITQLKLPGPEKHWRLGVLRIDQTFKGAETKTALIVLPQEKTGVVSSDRVDYAVGAGGLWYLRRYADDSRGLFLADHPQRLLSDDDPDRLQRRIDTLRE